MLVKLDDKLDDVVVVQVKQEAQLAEHMRRSLANEKAVDVLSKELKPVISHVTMVKGVGAAIGILALLATIYEAFRGH